MTIPNKQRLSAQLHCYNEREITAAAALTRLSCLTSPLSPNRHLNDHPDSSFRKPKSLGIDTTDQNEAIDKFHERTPPIQAHEVDGWLLESLGKQLETRVFPTAKRMHIDPHAVKKMIDNEFRKAYGLEFETNVLDPVIHHDKRDTVVKSTEVGTRAKQRNRISEHSEHSSGDKSLKASDNIQKTKCRYHSFSKASAKQRRASVRMMSINQYTSTGKSINCPNTALIEKPGLQIERHDNNIQIHDISQRRKKTLRCQAKPHKQKSDSFVITLTSKVAALKWQQLEYTAEGGGRSTNVVKEMKEIREGTVSEMVCKGRRVDA